MHSQLSPGVTKIATSNRDNAFLIDGDDGLTLIDVGWAKAPEALLNTIAALGRKPSDIRRVILTHAHPDHVQGAAELRRHTGAPILIHHGAPLTGNEVLTFQEFLQQFTNPLSTCGS